MPLNSQVKRNGKARKIHWGGFHVTAMTLAAAIDSKEGKLYESILKDAPDMLDGCGIQISPSDVWHIMNYGVIAMTPLNSGDYTMQNEMKFKDSTDGEIFILKSGDVLSLWRD